MAKSRELLQSDRYMGFIILQNEKKERKKEKKTKRNQWNMGKVDILYQNEPGQRTRCTFHN